MMRSMFSGVTGLRNHQIRMDVIGNNIANVNTTAFKASRVSFRELFTQTVRGSTAPQTGRGGVNPLQIGLGVGLASVGVIQTAGSIQPTGKETDLSIQGEGFFIVNDGSRDYYTRDGAFEWDGNGYLVTNSGMQVRGWVAANGVLPALTAQTLTSIGGSSFNLGTQIQPKATTSVTFNKNLDADAAVSTSKTVPITLYDSLGNAHQVLVTFTKVGVNSWTWEPSVTVTGEDVGTGDGTTTVFNLANAPVKAGSYTIYVDGTAQVEGTDYTFNPETGMITFSLAPTAGQKITADYTYSPARVAGEAVGTGDGVSTTFTLANPPIVAGLEQVYVNGVLQTGGGVDYSINATTGVITFTAAPANNDSITADYTPLGGVLITFNPDGTVNTGGGTGRLALNPPGANPLTAVMDFSRVTQFADTSSVDILSQDGYATGTLMTLSIDTSGRITGSYSNGINQPLGQVALASFLNPSGLTRTANNLYQNSNNSGTASVGAAGTGGRGTIVPSSLEMSNVDLSQEFTDMIITQRGFQANARVITTSDEMLHELTSLKR